MIAPGPLLLRAADGPGWRDFGQALAKALAMAAAAAVGTKLGEWGIERARARIEKKPAAEPPKTEPGATP